MASPNQKIFTSTLDEVGKVQNFCSSNGDKISWFSHTYKCVASLNYIYNASGLDTPSKTSPLTLSSSLASQTCLLVAWKLPMYLVHKLKASLKIYHLAILPSNLHMFHTQPFTSFNVLSIGYIQWECTGPQMSSSSTR